MARCPSISTLFPYTTLFRSDVVIVRVQRPAGLAELHQLLEVRKPRGLHPGGLGLLHALGEVEELALVALDVRSEEHTSELQSPCNLVCRLLLEKKKKFI